MLLKVLTPTENEDIAHIIKEAFASQPWNDDWTEHETLMQYVTDITENANSLPLGLYNGHELVGLALGRLKHWFNGIEYCIDDFCIKPDYQGKGAGSEFMKLIKEYCAKEKFAKISLKTSKKAAAYGFYVKNGFKEQHDDVFFEYNISD